MTVKINRKKCIYCGGCVSVCPKDALNLKETMIEVDDKKCIDCKICIKFCPVEAINLV
jgi:ferredoxin